MTHLLPHLSVPGHGVGLKRQRNSMETELGNYDPSGHILEFSVNNDWREEGGSNERELTWWPAREEEQAMR